MNRESGMPGMTRFLALGGLILTLILAGFWVRYVCQEQVSLSPLHWRLTPFFVGFFWILRKQIKAIMNPETYMAGSSPLTFSFLTFISIGTPIDSNDFLLMSILMIIFVFMTMLFEYFEKRIKHAIEARKHG